MTSCYSDLIYVSDFTKWKSEVFTNYLHRNILFLHRQSSNEEVQRKYIADVEWKMFILSENTRHAWKERQGSMMQIGLSWEQKKGKKISYNPTLRSNISLPPPKNGILVHILLKGTHSILLVVISVLLNEIVYFTSCCILL